MTSTCILTLVVCSLRDLYPIFWLLLLCDYSVFEFMCISGILVSCFLVYWFLCPTVKARFCFLSSKYCLLYICCYSFQFWVCGFPSQYCLILCIVWSCFDVWTFWIWPHFRISLTTLSPSAICTYAYLITWYMTSACRLSFCLALLKPVFLVHCASGSSVTI